jgi:hypothetical protein
VLSKDDIRLFYRLYFALLGFAAEKKGLLREARSLAGGQNVPPEHALKAREALFKDPALIDEFIAGTPSGIENEGLRIIAGWKRFVKGSFLIMELRDESAVFLSISRPAKAYEVFPLNGRFADVLPFVPLAAEAVLLPFKGRIIYDGLLNAHHIMVGPGMEHGLKEELRRIEREKALVASLDESPAA